MFQVKEIWGEWILCDNCMDAGDVYLVTDCRKAIHEEIKREQERRVQMGEVEIEEQVS